MVSVLNNEKKREKDENQSFIPKICMLMILVCVLFEEGKVVGLGI